MIAITFVWRVALLVSGYRPVRVRPRWERKLTKLQRLPDVDAEVEISTVPWYLPEACKPLRKKRFFMTPAGENVI